MGKVQKSCKSHPLKTRKTNRGYVVEWETNQRAIESLSKRYGVDEGA
jgi:hypothetical protein